MRSLKKNDFYPKIIFKRKSFFAPENMKKEKPSKVPHNRPGCPNGPKTEITYHQKPLNAGLGI